MWAAARTLEESASLAARVAAGSSGDLQARMLEKERDQLRQAQLLRRLILEANELTLDDAHAMRSRTGMGKVSQLRIPKKTT
jgi:hypothetical protein